MAITNVRKLLLDLALKEKGETKIAKVLAYYYPSINFKDKKSIFESLFYYYQISDNVNNNLDNIKQEVTNDNELENLIGKDYRIKSIEISDLRGIPSKDEKGNSFGIDFFEDGIVNNAVILANNGVGKSSVFSGIEMIYTQEIGEKQLRTSNIGILNKDNYNKYLKRFPNETKPHCRVTTNQGAFDLDNIVFKNDRARGLPREVLAQR